MYFSKYINNLNSSLKGANEEIIQEFLKVLKFIIENEGTLVLCGNGGSFANSLHIAGDYHKTFAHNNASFHSVGENFCSISAIANDFCFEEAISIHLSSLIKKKVPTAVVFLSGSGNSINLINAAKLMNRKASNVDYLKTLSITAYGGGAISKLVNLALKFEINDMEIAEDIQLIIFHYLKQQLIKIFPIKEENYFKYNKRIDKGDII